MELADLWDAALMRFGRDDKMRGFGALQNMQNAPLPGSPAFGGIVFPRQLRFSLEVINGGHGRGKASMYKKLSSMPSVRRYNAIFENQVFKAVAEAGSGRVFEVGHDGGQCDGLMERDRSEYTRRPLC